MLVSKFYTTVALVASWVSAGLISTWAQDGRMQLAMVYKDSLLMGTCADSADDWVFNQTVALPSDFISVSNIEILYLGNSTGSDVTGLVYQNKQKDIVMTEYHCNGSDIIGPISNTTYNISTRVGFDSYYIKKGTPISATLATDYIPYLAVSWLDKNNTAWQFENVYNYTAVPSRLTQVSPPGFAAFGYTLSQVPDGKPRASGYAVNSTEFFYNVGTPWLEAYDVYGFPSSISTTATTNSTSTTDFIDTHQRDGDLPGTYDTESNCLAMTQDPRGYLVLWFFWVNEDNDLLYNNNVYEDKLRADNYTGDYDRSTFSSIYGTTKVGESVDRSYGISAFTDYQRNYSRVYWFNSELRQLAYSERDCSYYIGSYNGISYYNATLTPLPFEKATSTETDIANTTIINTSSTTTDYSKYSIIPVKSPVQSRLSTAAIAGIGIGAGLSVISFVSFLIWKLVQRRAKKPKPVFIENIEERYFATDADAIAIDSRVATPVCYKGPMELSAVVRPVEIATIVREPQEIMGDVPPRYELPLKPLPSLPVDHAAPASASVDGGNLLDRFPSPNTSPVSTQPTSSLPVSPSEQPPSSDGSLPMAGALPNVESSPSHPSTSN